MVHNPIKDINNVQNSWLTWVIPIFLSALLIVISQKYFLLFHTLAELFSIIIAIVLSVVAWQTYPFTRNNMLMYLGCGYFWISILDLIHTLVYKGMGVFPITEANPATQLWIASRYAEALLLLTAPLFLSKNLNRNACFILMGMIALCFALSIAYGYFPDCFIEGSGLTTFKVASEYIIIFLLMCSVIYLVTRQQQLDKGVIQLLIASVVLTICAELAFTFYVNVYGLSNLIGHIFKLLSYWLIFIAIVRTTLQYPFQMMARTASTYDAIPDAITVVDSNGIIRQANNPAMNLAGGELIGTHIHNQFHSSEISQDACPICQSIILKNKLNGMDVHVTKINRWFDFTLSPIVLGSQDAGMVHAMRDITSRKLAEEELRLHRENLETLIQDRTHELESANKELQSFSYSVSHDLRSPLRAISGFATALLEETYDRLNANEKDYLNRVVAGANKMSDLINSLLQLSRITRKELNKERVNLSNIAIDALSNFRKNSPERKVTSKIPAEIIVEGDQILLEVMLCNLLDNAWKYTSKTPDANIEFGTLQKENQTIYFIKDNGAGFDLKYADKLFGAFQRLHKAEEYPGTGIGLATVQRIIHRHGGEIWAESEVNKGSTFYFTLPNIGLNI